MLIEHETNEDGNGCSSGEEGIARSMLNALFVWTYQQNQQPSSSVFLSQQTSEQCFQHNKPAKRTGCETASAGGQLIHT
jgi:hypothetical protein